MSETVSWVTGIDGMLTGYLAARGLVYRALDKGMARAERITDEARELQEAVARRLPHQYVEDEIADVVLATAVLARQLGVTVEDCIRRKTIRDTGRGDRD